MRRASIDNINAKYGRGGSTAVRPIVNAQPIATSTVVRAPALSNLQGAYVTGGFNRANAIGVAQPAHQVIEHPPVYEAVTTPTKVYEIVTPIIDVNKNVVQQEEVKNYQDDNQRIYAKSRKSRCPWWCWLLLCLLFLGLLIAGLLYFFRKQFGLAPAGVQQKDDNSNNATNQADQAKTGESKAAIGGDSNENDETNSQAKQISCKQGTHLVGGKCLSCPAGSNWNGSNCIKKVKQTKTVTETVPDDEQSKDGSESSQQSETKEPSENNNEKNEKVDHHHLSYYL